MLYKIIFTPVFKTQEYFSEVSLMSKIKNNPTIPIRKICLNSACYKPALFRNPYNIVSVFLFLILSARLYNTHLIF